MSCPGQHLKRFDHGGTYRFKWLRTSLARKEVFALWGKGLVNRRAKPLTALI